MSENKKTSKELLEKKAFDYLSKLVALGQNGGLTSNDAFCIIEDLEKVTDRFRYVLDDAEEREELEEIENEKA